MYTPHTTSDEKFTTKTSIIMDGIYQYSIFPLFNGKGKHFCETTQEKQPLYVTLITNYAIEPEIASPRTIL